MKVFPRFLYIALSVVFLTSCHNNPAKSAEAETTKKDTAAPPAAPASGFVMDKNINTNSHNKLNDVALYLAGMPSDSSSVPAKLKNLKSYKTYSDSLSAGFTSIETNRLSKMREWAKTELAPELATPKTVL